MCNNKELFFEISKLSVTVLRSISGIRDTESEKSEFTNFRLCCNNRGFLLEMVCDKKNSENIGIDLKFQISNFRTFEYFSLFSCPWRFCFGSTCPQLTSKRHPAAVTRGRHIFPVSTQAPAAVLLQVDDDQIVNH